MKYLRDEEDKEKVVDLQKENLNLDQVKNRSMLDQLQKPKLGLEFQKSKRKEKKEREK